MKILITTIGIAVLLAGCAPTVRLAVPEKPIVINLNVKIEHEIRVKVDKELDSIFNDEDLF
ncbi:MAG: YnbE family lipoprotein [Gammaproteobacteria bacterium]|nr:YnbE family lipoprotein [Gammaproteobacteria bacterium]